MNTITVNVAKSYVVPDTVTKLTITHEWGDIVVSNATVSGTYSFTPDSVGVYKFTWLNGTTVVRTDHYDCVLKLVGATDFFSDYSEYEDRDDEFDKFERKVRLRIQTITGQKFGPYIAKTLEMQGDGGDALSLPVRIMALSSVSDEFGSDYSDITQIGAGSEWFIEYRKNSLPFPYRDIKRDITEGRRNFFTDTRNFLIVGDFGWYYVPQDISEAAKLLIADEYSGDAEINNRGYVSASLGDFSYSLNRKSSYDGHSTGNAEADLLLASYTVLNIGLA